MNRWQQSEPPTRREGLRRWRRLRLALIAVAVLLAIGLFLSYRYSPNRPAKYAEITEHFKYGSIGSDFVSITNPAEEGNGLPLAVMRVLPRMFPNHLPPGGPKDYTAFGFIQERGHALPIGFATRRCGIDLVGLNCAVCHVGSVRASQRDEPQIYLAMSANTVDLQAFFEFLFNCADDPRFTPDEVVAEIEKDGALFPLDRLLLREAVSRMKTGVQRRRDQFALFLGGSQPRFGPGRVDTFNPYKAIQFGEYYQHGLSATERIGASDFPTVWNQRPREGMQLHWDGNNSSVRERNVSAAFGAGATRNHVDLASIDRVMQWLGDLPPPPFPFPDRIDRRRLPRGERVFLAYCYRCHGFGGAEVGNVVQWEDIRTDRRRLDSYTLKLQQLQRDYGRGYPWEFLHFQKTDGYSNQPLDGVWARAPYLHNGSVPTLAALLTPAEERSREPFYRGHDVYDPDKVGFRTDVAEIAGRKAFLFDVTLPGNDNGGHSGRAYGTELSDDDKRSLIEYLKTL